jgi:hypothetical protein
MIPLPEKRRSSIAEDESNPEEDALWLIVIICCGSWNWYPCDILHLKLGCVKLLLLLLHVKLCVYAHCMDEQLGEMGKARGT